MRKFDHMKTRIQWFNGLPEEVKQQALRNYQNNIYGKLKEPDFLQRFNSLEECLSNSFVFGKTAEGRQYWLDVISREGGSK